jgi:hypothetical protein
MGVSAAAAEPGGGFGAKGAGAKGAAAASAAAAAAASASPHKRAPPGYRARLAALHARAVAGLLVAGGLLALAGGAALLALPRLWPLWAAAEAGFLLLWLARKRALDRVPAQHYTGPDGHCALDTIRRFHRSLPLISESIDSYGLVRPWFHGAPVESIRRGNVRELLAYGFGYRTA